VRLYFLFPAIFLPLGLSAGAASASQAASAPKAARATQAPKPAPRHSKDNISRIIQAAAPDMRLIKPQAKPSESLHFTAPAQATPPRAAAAAPGNPPVPQPAPANARAAAAPAADTAAEPAPAFTVPVPIPAPMPAPLAEPAPAPLPQTNAPLTAPAERYEAAPNAPLTYAPSLSTARFAPRFGDRKPHVWTSRLKPWHYAIHGSDVSWHNQGINWSAMARGGISFVFIKATEGGDYLDPAFKQNWQAAKLAGLARGAYHFYYFCRPAKDQLSWYIHNVPRDRNAMPPVLDIEWNHTSPTCRRHPPAAEVQKDMEIFLRGVEKYYGKKPIIYTTVDFFQDSNLNVFRKKYPFWLRSVAAHPDDRYNGHPWLFWQYTGTGRVPGIAGDTDISVFAGSAKQWQSWLKTIRR